jgi:hypothetical protein
MVLGITTAAHGQGIAPGGPVYNSTGIGSGIGNVPGGTAPIYPNGTTAPALPRAIPPGGLPPVGRIDNGFSPAPPPASLMSRYPQQPLDPYPLPLSHRKMVKDPDAGKDATDRGKDSGAPPASAL